jgi:hypothetical protein
MLFVFSILGIAKWWLVRKSLGVTTKEPLNKPFTTRSDIVLDLTKKGGFGGPFQWLQVI